MANRPTPIILRPVAPGEEITSDNMIPLYVSNPQEVVDRAVANGATIVRREGSEDSYFYLLRDRCGFIWKIATENLSPPPPPPPSPSPPPPPPPS